MTKQMWSIPKAVIYGTLFGVSLILLHLNDHIQKSQFSPALEMMHLISGLVIPVGIFAGIVAIRNAFARRHNHRIARNEERYG